jgi:Fur family transcriptional regulator, ferric uptake regulator
MSYDKEIIQLLTQKNIKATAMRILVLQFFLDQKVAISLSKLEGKFLFSDRTTLYRTLKTFEEKGLIHAISDGTTSTKYAICEDHCTTHHHIDIHPHFHCTKCNETTCLNTINIPEIKLEDSYTTTNMQFIINGICNKCNSVA